MRNGFWKSLIGLIILVVISAAAIYVKIMIMNEREDKAGQKMPLAAPVLRMPQDLDRVAVVEAPNFTGL